MLKSMDRPMHQCFPTMGAGAKWADVVVNGIEGHVVVGPDLEEGYQPAIIVSNERGLTAFRVYPDATSAEADALALATQAALDTKRLEELGFTVQPGMAPG